MGLFVKPSAFRTSPIKPRSKIERNLDEMLHEAVKEESLDVVRFLLKKGAQPMNGARTDADTAGDSVERGHAWVNLIDEASGAPTPDAMEKADLLIQKSGYNGNVVEICSLAHVAHICSRHIPVALQTDTNRISRQYTFLDQVELSFSFYPSYSPTKEGVYY